jgi:hypothetical protein
LAADPGARVQPRRSESNAIGRGPAISQEPESKEEPDPARHLEQN